MTKSYMSRTERTNFLFLNALTAKTQEIESELTAHNGDKEVLKNLRTGLTFIRKALQTWTQPIDDKNIDKLLNEVALYNVGLIFHKDAMKHVVSMEEADRTMRREVNEQLGNDPSFTLAEWTMKMMCRQCDGSPKLRECGCPILKALEALKIPTWDTDGVCAYSGAGNVSEVKYEA